MTATIDDVLDFWFCRPGEPEYNQRRDIWWEKNPAFDALIRDRFMATYRKAAAGALDHWAESVAGALALVILLDQVPRNMFRDDPRAYATDALALATAKAALARGFDKALPEVRGRFFYTPFEHSENLADQCRSVALFTPYFERPEGAETRKIILRHKEIIERFGRFPHRNAALGRDSTAEEIEFLKEPMSSF